MKEFQFLFGQTPETVTPMHVDARNEGQGEWDSMSINIGYSDTECFAEIKSFKTSGFLQDFDEWKRIAYLMRAAAEMAVVLQRLIADYDNPDELLFDAIEEARAILKDAIK